MKFPTKTVLFIDFDGVLCNSELFAESILLNLLNKYFLNLDCFSILPLVNGLNGIEIVNYLINKHSVKLKNSYKDVQNLKEEMLKDFNLSWSNTYENVQITEYIKTEIHTLKTLTFELILVSSASLELISKLITDIKKCFSKIYTGENLKYNKKDPRLWNYLKSIHFQNKAEYICIDDNFNVIEAAKEAGILTFQHKYGDSLFSRFLGRSCKSISINKKPILLKIDSLEFYENQYIDFTQNKKFQLLDNIWSDYKKKNNTSFNGPQAFVQGISLEEKTLKLYGKTLGYKFILLPDSPLFRLAIQAIVIFKNKFIVGKRSKNSMDEVDSFEFIPAGGVEYFSFKAIDKQITTETSEEIGIKNLDIVSSSCFGACIDLNHKVIDLLYLLNVKKKFNLNNFKKKEHESVELVNKEWVIENKKSFTISSKLFIDCFLLP